MSRCHHYSNFTDILGSDNEDDDKTSSASSVFDSIHESDEEFVEVDSDAEFSAEDYELCSTASEGSSELWDENDSSDAVDEHQDDNFDITDTSAIISQHDLSKLVAAVRSLAVDNKAVSQDGHDSRSEIAVETDDVE